MARSCFISLLGIFCLELIMAVSVNSQGYYNTGSSDPYYGSAYQYHDPYYHGSSSGGYQQQQWGFQPYNQGSRPSPAVISPAASAYPNIYNYYNSPANSYPASSSYDLNTNQFYPSSNPYPAYWGYDASTASPPQPTTTPQPDPPESLSAGGGGEEELEAEDGVAASPVFNSRAFLRPQQVLPAWPYETMKNTKAVSGSPGQGRHYVLPQAVGGPGLLESVANAQHHRSQSSPSSYSNRNGLGTNPLFLMMAFNGLFS